MRTQRDRNWDALGDALLAQSSDKTPRLFSSRKTLFGIPSALDQEMAKLEEACNQARKQPDTTPAAEASSTASASHASDTSPASGTSAKKASAMVTHPLPPIYDDASRVLILGTMPSPTSRATGFYYNHPQNRFWKVLAALFEEEAPQTNEDKGQFVLRHGIALWDVLAQCEIEGASDATIAHPLPNDIASLVSKAPIRAIFCTGAKATELFETYCAPHVSVPFMRLPSTSSANASASLDDLIAHYAQILDWL